jgi:hypothetical protein
MPPFTDHPQLLVAIAALNFATEVIKAFRTFWEGRWPHERSDRQARAYSATNRRRIR